MDDDCLPEKDSLLKLISLNPDSNVVLNSTVLSNDQTVSGKLAFAIYDKSKDILYRNRNDFNDILIPSANFFNGTFISKNIIQQIGLPLVSMFIRGEEYEYLLRIETSGFKVFTVKDSLVFHPPASKIIFDNKYFRYEYLILDYSKRFYTIRNLTYITKKYTLQKKSTLFKIILLDLIIMISRLEFSLVFAEINGFFRGLFFKVKEA